MAVAPQFSLDLNSSNGREDVTSGPPAVSPSLPSPGNGSTPPQLRTLSVSSSSGSSCGISSDEFRRLHSKEGLSLDLGSEAGNVADIFGSMEANGLLFDEGNSTEKRYKLHYLWPLN